MQMYELIESSIFDCDIVTNYMGLNKNKYENTKYLPSCILISYDFEVNLLI